MMRKRGCFYSGLERLADQAGLRGLGSRAFFMCAFIVACLQPGLAFSKVIYVHSGVQSNAQDGASWLNAFAAISQAINASQPGDQIWVASGGYQEQRLRMMMDTALLGGFQGVETSPAQRPEDGGRARIDGQGNPMALIVGQGCWIDRIEIENGGESAVFMDGVSAWISNSVFRNNKGDMAGAIACQNQSTLWLEDCRVEENESPQASAMLILDSSSTIKNCVFIKNRPSPAKSDSPGSAILAEKNANLTLDNCLFEFNAGQTAGAVFSSGQSDVSFRDCRFRWNRSQTWAGAASINDSTFAMSGCHFEYNQAPVGAGACLIQDSRSDIRSTVFYRNQALNDESMGGGLAARFGVCALTDVDFVRNSADIGGGLVLHSMERATLDQLKIFKNAASSEGGGVVFIFCQDIGVNQTIISENTAASLGGGIEFTGCPKAKIADSWISHNVAKRPNGNGAGGYVYDSHVLAFHTVFHKNAMHPWMSKGGGLHVKENGKIDLFFSSLSGNYAAFGAEICARGGGDATIQNCSIIGLSGLKTVGIDCRHYITDPPTVKSVENFSGVHQSILFNHWAESAHPILSDGRSVFTGKETPGLPIFSTIDEFRFYNPSHGDFRLHSDSPLIDATVNSSPIGTLLPIDGDGDGIAQWDIGAYEYDPRLQQ